MRSSWQGLPSLVRHTSFDEPDEEYLTMTLLSLPVIFIRSVFLHHKNDIFEFLERPLRWKEGTVSVKMRLQPPDTDARSPGHFSEEKDWSKSLTQIRYPLLPFWLEASWLVIRSCKKIMIRNFANGLGISGFLDNAVQVH